MPVSGASQRPYPLSELAIKEVEGHRGKSKTAQTTTSFLRNMTLRDYLMSSAYAATYSSVTGPAAKRVARVLDLGGWEVRKILHQRDMADLVASLGYVLNDRGQFPRLAGKLAAFPDTQGKLYLLKAFRVGTCPGATRPKCPLLNEGVSDPCPVEKISEVSCGLR